MASSITTSEKVRENRLRRMAERQGLALRKSPRPDPRALDFGTYMLVDAHNTVVVGGPDGRFGLSLDEVQAALSGDG